MHFQIQFRDDDYHFAFTSFDANTIEEAIAETRRKLKDYKSLECSIFLHIGFLWDENDTDLTAEDVYGTIGKLVHQWQADNNKPIAR